MGTPVPQGGVQGQGLHGVIPQHLALHRPGVDNGHRLVLFRRLGRRLLGGLEVIRLLDGWLRLLRRGVGLNRLWLLFQQRVRAGGIGTVGLRVGEDYSGVAPCRFHIADGIVHGVNEIIARHSNGGDT